MKPLSKGEISELKRLTLDAAAKADQVERLNKKAVSISRIFNSLSILPRKTIAGTAVSSITFALLALTTLPITTKFLASPFFALGTGGFAVLLTPASLEDRKRRELKELQQRYKEAKRRGQYNLAKAIEEQQISLIKMNSLSNSKLLPNSNSQLFSSNPKMVSEVKSVDIQKLEND